MRLLRQHASGLMLCAGVALVALACEQVQRLVFGRVHLDLLLSAILAGGVWAALRPVTDAQKPGIDFSARRLLEAGIVCLGAGFQAGAVLALDGRLVGAVIAIVLLVIASGYVIGRMLRLDADTALLVACGTAICGNSAISAIAPIRNAPARTVSAAIAFTAVLGVIEVLCLPMLGHVMGMAPSAYGALSGLTVYAVPQVVAATSPYAAQSLEMGTLVKLMRVLMLGPVMAVLSLTVARRNGVHGKTQLIPWFVAGFAAMLVLRSLGWIGDGLAAVLGFAAHGLTLMAMAALGLSLNLSDLRRSGLRVTAAGALSLLVLTGLSLAVIGWLKI